jgi:hypothetical protein
VESQAAERSFGWNASGRSPVGSLAASSPGQTVGGADVSGAVLGGEIFTDVEIQRTHRDGSTIDLNMASV